MRCLPLLLSCLPVAALAASPAQQDPEQLRTQGTAFLAARAEAAYPGSRIDVRIGRIDERLRLRHCPAPEFFLPASSREWGSGNLGARCTAPEAWTLYLGYQIDIKGAGWVARRPLPARAPITASDWETRDIDYLGNPDAYVRDIAPLAGATLARPVNAGTSLQTDMLVQARVVRAGQRVRLLVVGAGFQVSREGIAQNNAHAGEPVKVKLEDKRIVQGTAASDGSVRVSP